ncbi:MAG: NAD(P)-binding domain-containing protein [Gemmatimonadota bacterium]
MAAGPVNWSAANLESGVVNFLIYLGFGLFLIVPVVRAMRRTAQRERSALAAAAKANLSTEGPKAQHPRIDISSCIGCGACTVVCPEGDVLAVIAGKAAIVNGPRCIGHGLCANACPVGAIEIVMAPPSLSADLPALSPEFESSVPGLFVVGELGGLALIKNAVNQGRDCVDTVSQRLNRGPRDSEVVDVAIVGAGPGGLSASLRAIEKKLSYVTFEQGELGGTVAQYPRQKLVLTSPVEFPMHGKFRKLELSKEDLLKFWQQIARDSGLKVNAHERIDEIARGADGLFTLRSLKGSYLARTVVLALGRRGSPRKLGVPGEDLPKVMYSLIDAEAYTGKRILIVGGGDSAVEAAMGLAVQRGNRVVLSYRQSAFGRIKERNAKRLEECRRSGSIEILLESQVREIQSRTVILEARGERRELENDFVWIFAGGTPPDEFLRRVGIQLGPRDLTSEAAAEALRVA